MRTHLSLTLKEMLLEKQKEIGIHQVEVSTRVLEKQFEVILLHDAIHTLEGIVPSLVARMAIGIARHGFQRTHHLQLSVGSIHLAACLHYTLWLHELIAYHHVGGKISVVVEIEMALEHTVELCLVVPTLVHVTKEFASLHTADMVIDAQECPSIADGLDGCVGLKLSEMLKQFLRTDGSALLHFPRTIFELFQNRLGGDETTHLVDMQIVFHLCVLLTALILKDVVQIDTVLRVQCQFWHWRWFWLWCLLSGFRSRKFHRLSHTLVTFLLPRLLLETLRFVA